MNALAIVGLAIMVASEAATLAGSGLVGTWNTPICWTGFMLFGKPNTRLRSSESDASNGAAGSSPSAFVSIAIGALMLIWPLVWPSQYLAAPVWLGSGSHNWGVKRTAST